MRKTLMMAGLCGLVVMYAACATESPTTEQDAVENVENTQPAPAETPSAPPTYTPDSAPAQATPPPAQSAPPAAQPASTPAPAGPVMVEIPAGTILELETLRNLDTKNNVAGDRFGARVIDAVLMGGQVAIPEGSIVHGEVTQAISATKMKGQAMLTVNFHTLTLPSKEKVALSAVLSEEGKKIGKRTAGIVGGTAAGAALLGKIVGKDTKSAVKGALIGAAAGTAIAATQDGQELKLPKGTGIAIELLSAITVPVAGNNY
jgi:hypothetical protein